jgi:hypothetical protein
MNKVLPTILVTLAVALPGGLAFAQSQAAQAARGAELRELAATLRDRDAEDRLQVRDFARRAGIPTRRQLPDGRLLELQRIAPGIGPVFYVTNNVDAADTVSTDEVWPGGSAGLDLDGGSMTVGEWDGGAVLATHPDLAGRVSQVDAAAEVSEHSTHVAGTLIGAGADPFYPQARGMAFAASLDAYDWNSDTAEMALAAANGMLVSNHSYGIAAGWLYLGDAPPDTWWWIGGADPADVEDANFGYYDSQAQLWDQIARDAPYYLIVKAGGNDRWDTGPVPGEEYTVIDQDGNFLFTSTLPRNADCAPVGYDCLPGNSVAKNILTVGAVDDLPGGYSALAGPSQVQMTGFSGWGPTDDGRIKPDLVGNGMWLVSTWPSNPGYAAALGTSMATPNVTGSLLLLQEHFEDINGNGNFMRAATLKALTIHTADEAGDADGPDYEFGWGLLNTWKAARVITGDGGDHRIIEDTLSSGGVDTFAVSVSNPDSVIRATLVWADPPATPVAPTLDPPDLMLVNDLDLRIRRGPSAWLPWVLNPANPAAAAGKGDNFRDNVEQVVAEVASTGSYTVEVRHKGTLQDGIPQDYSLIVSVEPAPSNEFSYPIDEDFSGGMPAGWTVDTVQGVPWAIMTPVPGDQFLDNRTGGSGPFAMVNNDFTRTTTSLLPPRLDLSTATGVILSFDSAMQFSDWETINVDISTNGGATWTNVWYDQGLIGLPHHYVLDLTGHLAGQASASLRFRYYTWGDIMGYYWQVDNVRLQAYGVGPPPPPGDPPTAASEPFPAHGEADLGTDANLNWTAGDGAESHDVYFGTTSPPAVQGNQGGTGFDPGTLAHDTIYYWRIDEVNAAGTTEGPEWVFTTGADGPPPDAPGQASEPSPPDGANGVGIDSSLGWVAGSGSASHDLFFGTDSPPAFVHNQTAVGYDPGMLAYGTTYYWRIDEVNETETTAGVVWSFTTEAEPPPPPPTTTDIHIASLQATSIPGSRGRWSARVQIAVVDDDSGPVVGALVEGGWSDGANGGDTCTTNASGTCAVQKDNLKSNVASVLFSVTHLSGTDLVYDAAANEVADSITVNADGGSSDLTPVARDDSFTTGVDTALSGNTMTNDTPGDAPTTVSAYDTASTAGGSVSMNGSGDFSYMPPAGWSGTDSFGYTLTDNDGDSDTGTVTITVESGPVGGLALSVGAIRDKGVWFADLAWSGAASSQVEIRLNGAPLASVANNGSYRDELGKKPAGTYTYEVCETGGGPCVADTLTF